MDKQAFLEVKLVGFDLNLIAMGLYTISPIPSLVSFTFASPNKEYSGISTMANSQRKQQPTEDSQGAYVIPWDFYGESKPPTQVC